MSLPAILWAMYEAPATTNPTEKCVLMVLAEHANTSGASAYPSWERIAKIVGVSTRTIGSTMSSLHAKGLIRRGDQRIAEAAVRGRGKSRAYAPTVWDLVMDGSHAAATQAHLPPAVDEDREATVSRLGPEANVQLGRPAPSAGLKSVGSAPGEAAEIPAAQEPCRSCRSTGACSETCNLTSPSHEVSRRSGVKPASEEPSTSTKNLNPPPRLARGDEGTSNNPRPTAASGEAGGAEKDVDEDVELDIAGFVAAVRAALPPPLGRQPIGRALERRCAALAAAGWTADQVADAVGGRCWDGAGVGAVVSWLADLCQEDPATQRIARQRVSGGAGGDADLAEEYRKALTLAAASDSPARAAARKVAAAASARSRERRGSSVR